MNPAVRLEIEMSEADRDLIVSLLERERTGLPHEIHHTTTSAMRHELEQRLDRVEALLKMLGGC